MRKPLALQPPAQDQATPRDRDDRTKDAKPRPPPPAEPEIEIVSLEKHPAPAAVATAVTAVNPPQLSKFQRDQLKLQQSTAERSSKRTRVPAAPSVLRVYDRDERYFVLSEDLSGGREPRVKVPVLLEVREQISLQAVQYTSDSSFSCRRS